MFEITTAIEFQQLLSDYQYVVVDVYADWCTPCKMSAPLFEETYHQCQAHFAPNTVIFVKLNVERNLLRDITGLPTFLIYREGQLVQQYAGLNGIDDIKKFFQQLAPTNETAANKAVEVGKKHYKTFGSL